MSAVLGKLGEGRTLLLYPGYFEAGSELFQAGGAFDPQHLVDLMAHYDTEVVF